MAQVMYYKREKADRNTKRNNYKRIHTIDFHTLENSSRIVVFAILMLGPEEETIPVIKIAPASKWQILPCGTNFPVSGKLSYVFFCKKNLFRIFMSFLCHIPFKIILGDLWLGTKSALIFVALLRLGKLLRLPANVGGLQWFC